MIWIWKNNSLFNLITQQPDIDKFYLYAEDPYKTKYELLITKRQITGKKYLNDSKAFTEYSNDMDGIYKNIEDRIYNPNKRRKILIIVDMGV